MLKNLSRSKKANKRGKMIDFRKVISTNAGMYSIWNLPSFNHISDYDEWEKELLEDTDIERHINQGIFVPIDTHLDGVVDVLIHIGTKTEFATLTEREKKYKYVSSEEYLIETHGELGLSGLEFRGRTIDENIGVLQVS